MDFYAQYNLNLFVYVNYIIFWNIEWNAWKYKTVAIAYDPLAKCNWFAFALTGGFCVFAVSFPYVYNSIWFDVLLTHCTAFHHSKHIERISSLFESISLIDFTIVRQHKHTNTDRQHDNAEKIAH